MVREVQKDPIRGNLIHVDFYEVNMAEKIKVEVPIVIVGESPALKIRENMLYQTLNSLHYRMSSGQNAGQNSGRYQRYQRSRTSSPREGYHHSGCHDFERS